VSESHLYKLIEENAHFIVVHKFPGVGFHDERDGEVLRPGLASALKEQFGVLYPVHRLDKITSGLLLFAKGYKHLPAVECLIRDPPNRKILFSHR